LLIIDTFTSIIPGVNSENKKSGYFRIVITSSVQQTKYVEKQITTNAGNHILTNSNIWSPDSQWIVYDVRSDFEGALFDGESIEMVHVGSGEVWRLYAPKHGAKCGVVTFDPQRFRVAFILGPEYPSTDWQYGPSHRQGVSVEVDLPELAINLDARDLTAPLTPGALRGGSHVHMWDSDGEWLSFTYNDALLDQFTTETAENDIDQRNVGVSAPQGEVRVKKDHARNHDGALFSVLVTRTTGDPRPGSDDIGRACEESWVGKQGYLRPDGSRQHHSLAFQGEVVTSRGERISEVFITDLPEDLTIPSPNRPLEGTPFKRPLPPLGTEQRRLTYTENNAYPGLQGPRHWLKSSPDGSQIGFLMRDNAGVVQIWTVSPNGGAPQQITRDLWNVASAFSWSPGSQSIAYVADKSIFVVDVVTGESTRLTLKCSDQDAPLPLACVFSPDGKRIAYLRRVPLAISVDSPRWNQIFTVMTLN
jgi:Tol biopolymer transport system component